MGSSVTSGIAESSDGHEAEVTHVEKAVEEASIGPGQVTQDDGVEVGDTCAPVGEDGTHSSPTASNQEGPDSILHRESPPSDTVVQATRGGDTDSAKAATALKEGQVAEEFFRDTASQLTYYGLAQLYQEVWRLLN